MVPTSSLCTPQSLDFFNFRHILFELQTSKNATDSDDEQELENGIKIKITKQECTKRQISRGLSQLSHDSVKNNVLDEEEPEVKTSLQFEILQNLKICELKCSCNVISHE